MKAITLWQPWASLVAVGLKRAETRGWSTRYRGPLAIHAAARVPKAGECPACEPCYDMLGQLYGSLTEAWTEEEQVAAGFPADGNLHGFPLPLGAVVATCTLADVVPIFHRSQGPTAIGPRILELNGWEPELGAQPAVTEGLWYIGPDRMRRMDDQRPFGDYSHGRFAWLLNDVKYIDPVPAVGRQGLWEWDEAA